MYAGGCLSAKEIEDYGKQGTDGPFTDNEIAWISDHLDSCESCRNKVSDVRVFSKTAQ